MSCDLYREMESVDILGMMTKCRYHKKKDQFSATQLREKFGCLPLFHALYPHFLSALYGGQYDHVSRRMKCPGVESSVTVELHTEPIRTLHIRLMNKIKALLHFLYPADRIENEIGFRVIETKGHCPARYKVGDTYKIDVFSSLCPASAFSIYPEVIVAEDCTKVQCPSNANRVMYGKSCHDT